MKFIINNIIKGKKIERTKGIFLSVIIYYINNFLSVLGTNEKIPLTLSIFLPLIILSIINFISIIKLNEK